MKMLKAGEIEIRDKYTRVRLTRTIKSNYPRRYISETAFIKKNSIVVTREDSLNGNRVLFVLRTSPYIGILIVKNGFFCDITRNPNISFLNKASEKRFKKILKSKGIKYRWPKIKDTLKGVSANIFGTEKIINPYVQRDFRHKDIKESPVDFLISKVAKRTGIDKDNEILKNLAIKSNVKDIVSVFTQNNFKKDETFTCLLFNNAPLRYHDYCKKHGKIFKEEEVDDCYKFVFPIALKTDIQIDGFTPLNEILSTHAIGKLLIQTKKIHLFRAFQGKHGKILLRLNEVYYCNYSPYRDKLRKLGYG